MIHYGDIIYVAVVSVAVVCGMAAGHGCTLPWSGGVLTTEHGPSTTQHRPNCPYFVQANKPSTTVQNGLRHSALHL